MRQVNRDELIYIIQAAMRPFSATMLKGLQDWRPTEKLRARVAAATIIADKLKHFEILTDRPEGPPIHYADLDGSSGVPARETIAPNAPQ